jgi:hypothetical protein
MTSPRKCGYKRAGQTRFGGAPTGSVETLVKAGVRAYANL